MNKHIIALMTDNNHVSGLFINGAYTSHVASLLTSLDFIINNNSNSSSCDIYTLKNNDIKSITKLVMDKMHQELFLDSEKIDTFYCEEKEIEEMLNYIDKQS